MKQKILALLTLCALLYLIPIAVQAQRASIGNIDEVNRFIRLKDCAGAEAYARNYFQRPLFYTLLGMIYLDCKQDRNNAVEYFKMAAGEGETIAVEMLISIGEKSVNARRSNADQSAGQGGASGQDLQPPPPHPFTTFPQPSSRPQPPRVIIIQPAFNPAACIQDGGGTYCPYYRR